jgi:hypothetical protein
MHITNKKNNNNGYVIATKSSIAIATLFTFAIMVAASNIATTTTPAEATATPNTTATTTTTTTTSSPEIELSPEIVYQERQINTNETPINQTHVQLTTSGNGTLTLPNTTETISTTSTGNILASFDGTASGKVVITTENGSESATATIYALIRYGMEEERGILMALVDTDSTAVRLAPLDGMILAGLIEFPPEETSAALITLSEWQSGIPLPTSTTNSMEEPPIMNTTTTTMTTTNAITANTVDDLNATAVAPAIPEEEVVEEQQQQATPTAPSPLPE